GSTKRDITTAGEQLVYIGDDIAIAETQYGKVQGFILRGIYQFRGIPYGADTGGKNRFMPPQPPEPWDDIYPAVWWGNSAPQIMENRYANAWSSFRDHWNYDDVSEDCLKLNVWTPALADGQKRPVMVWFHGGGFTNGNGIEQDGYKGENLSRKGNIVFVSINHRLGPIGFSDLSGVGGPAYASSGNAGTLDMVAALEWVHENIENFGGDPDNVTIMGQSGGGAKVCTLLAMPATNGLIHKAVPLSGNITGAIDQHYSQLVGAYILREAGLKPSEIGHLQEIPWEEYIHLANRAARKCAEEQGNSGRMRGSFGPVADRINIPEGIFFSDPEGPSAHVPMLISSTFNEWSSAWVNPGLASITREEAIEMLEAGEGIRVQLGDAAGEVYRAYADAFPQATPYEITTLISSNRKGVIRTANAKSVQPAPVYVAWFGWDPPMFNGRMGAFHCLDICFWYDNTDEMWSHTGGGKRPKALAEKMSGTLLQFMKTGNPNDGGLPQWPVYTIEKGETMVLDDVSEVQNDPDREARMTIPD
ncbi:MAG: carboxylesterase/lipase family protein, partial [Bacteroidales bacterium]